MFSSSILVLVFWLVCIIFFRLFCICVGVSLCSVLLLFSVIIIMVGFFLVSRFGRWVSVLVVVFLFMLVLMMCVGVFDCCLICCCSKLI